MNVKQVLHQKSKKLERDTSNQSEPLDIKSRGETRSAVQEKQISGHKSLLEMALGRDNMTRAWKHVRANKGAPGVDGLTISATIEMLKQKWPTLKLALLSGQYRPQPTLQVVIAKASGGERKLGIPTVTDRLIQQALLQVLQPIFDPSFSQFSYGFRPGRSAQDAVSQAYCYVQADFRTVVDVDLENFFDRVNHDILMNRVARKCTDRGALRLIRRYLTAEIMVSGKLESRNEGTPQGGPLSPLLANVLLDEVDKVLEKRGHQFVRYADDCNVYVRSQKAGERVLSSMRQMYVKLKLVVNEKKTFVGPIFGRRILGYTFRKWAGDTVRIGISSEALGKFKQRIRFCTGRARGRSIEQVSAELREFVPGWRNYFQLARTPSVYAKLDQWLRHRLRALQLKQWGGRTATYRGLRNLGATDGEAQKIAGGGSGWWRCSRFSTNTVLTVAHFDKLGVPRLSETSTS